MLDFTAFPVLKNVLYLNSYYLLSNFQTVNPQYIILKYSYINEYSCEVKTHFQSDGNR